jgi:hypothetical protein
MLLALNAFWAECFHKTGGALRTYSVLSELVALLAIARRAQWNPRGPERFSLL